MNNKNKSLVVLTSKTRSFLSLSLCLRFPVSALLMSTLLLSSVIAAIPGRMGISIAQQPTATQQEKTRAAAKRLFDEAVQLSKQGTPESRRQAIGKWLEVLTPQQQIRDLFSKVELAVMPTSANFGQYPIKIGQSPATKPQNAKPAPSEAAAKFKQLIDKANQLSKEALQLQAQPSAEARRQAIAKYEELLKIWRLPEVRAVIPKDARIFEASALSSIGSIYSSLSENKKAAKSLEQALAIFQELKEPKARFIEASAFFTLGRIYMSLGEKQKAIDAFTQAQSLFHADNNPNMEAQVLFGIATVYGTFGEPKKMLEPLNQALAIQKANPNSQEAFITQGSVLGAIATSHQTLGETNKALEHYQQALQFYRQAKDLSGQASTLSSLGSVYALRNEHKQAEESFRQALELQKTIQRQLQQTLPPASSVAVPQKNATLEQIQQKAKAELARYQYFYQQFSILNTIATNYNLMGDYGQEIAYLNQALAVAREGGLTQYEADVLSNIGQAYFFLGEIEKAKDFLKQALKLQRAINYAQGEAETLTKIASVNENSGEFQQALDNLKKSLDNLKQQQNPFQEGQTLSEMASVYKNLGAYDLSIAKYEEALKIFQQKYPLLTASTLYLTGIAYWKSGKSQKTPEDYVQAKKSFEMALKYAREQGSVLQEASILSGIARTYESLKDYPQAIANANQALELSRKHNLNDAQGTALNVLSIVYEAAGDYQKALDANKQAMKLSQQLGELSSQASAYQIQGKIYTSMKQPQQAIEAYNQELKLGQQIGDISHETIALHQIAMIERDRGNLNQAETQIEIAIKIIESTRRKVTSPDLRTSYFATVQDYYKFYIDLLMQLQKKDPSKGHNALALHISERARARNLLELLAKANVDIRQGVDSKLVELERSLQQQLDAAEFQRVKLLQGQYTNKQLENIKQRVESFNSQLDDVQAQIRVNSPEYATLTQGNQFDKLVLTLPQIQQLVLDDSTLLLEYSLGEERSFLWAVSKTGITSYELPKGADIEAAAQSFKKELLDKKDSAALPETGMKLSKMILAPVASQLKQKRLLIVGDGALQTIPFTVLPIPGSSQNSSVNTKGNSPTPMLVQNEIVTLPSASSIGVLRNKFIGRKQAPKTIAVLADPVFSSDDQRLTHIPQRRNDESRGSELDNQTDECLNLGSLKYTKEEANNILSLEPNSTKKFSALGFAASVTTAVKPDLSQYQIVHFATHGCVSEKNPQLSKLVLSRFDEKGDNIDGNLNLNKIYKLKLPVELVTLSACKTGLGKNVQGEGLIGLTRGFMYAGAKRVVVSLWSVDDLTTASLMQTFYQKMLQQNQNPVAAMRAAQLEMWKSGKAPYYWAAFTMQGEWQ